MKKLVVVRGVFHGKETWSSPQIDQLRKTDCLCLNCDNLKPDQPDNCPIAQANYEACVKYDLALAMTRCSLWKPKEDKS